jgi:hypothetical protein
LYKRKILALFIKLDIANAFDTLNWTYLLSIMEHLGFGLRWRIGLLLYGTQPLQLS